MHRAEGLQAASGEACRYLQRCMVKNLEALHVHYDATVRDDTDGSIVQVTVDSRMTRTEHAAIAAGHVLQAMACVAAVFNLVLQWSGSSVPGHLARTDNRSLGLH